MYFCCKSLCILIVRPCILIVVMYSYCSSMYSYRCLCIIIVVYVYLSLSMYSHCYLRILRLGYLDWGFSVLFSAVVRQIPGYNYPRRGTARTLPKLLCCSMYCLFCIVLCILGNCPTWRTNPFQYIYLYFSTCFEHVMLIIRRNRLYQYSFW